MKKKHEFFSHKNFKKKEIGGWPGHSVKLWQAAAGEPEGDRLKRRKNRAAGGKVE